MAHDEHGINVRKMTIPPKTVYRLNAFQTKTTHNILQRLKKKILKFLRKQKGSSITKAIFREKKMLVVLLFQNSRNIREL